MISKEEFKYRIECEILPYLEEEEKRRKRVLFYYQIIPLILSVSLFIIEVATIPFFKINDLIAICLLTIAFMPYILGKYKLQKYQKFVAKDYALPVFDLLDINWDLNLKYPSIMLLRNLGFFPKHTERTETSKESAFYIDQRDTRIYVKQIKVKKYSKIPKIIFWGPVICFQINKNFKTDLMLLNKKDYSFFDEMGEKYAVSSSQVKWQKIKFDDANLDKEFKVFTSNQTLVKSLLSPLLIKKLKTIEEIYQAPLNALFYQNNLILSINMHSDIFNFFSSKTKVTITQFLTLYDNINTLSQLTEILNIKE